MVPANDARDAAEGRKGTRSNTESAEQPSARSTDRDGDVDSARLVRFFGTLLLFALGFVAVARLANVRMVALAPAYMFTPAVAAAVTVFTTEVSIREVGVRIGRTRWHAAAVVAVLVLVAVALGIALAVPGIGFDGTADPVPGIPLPSGALGVLALVALTVGTGVTVNALFALGEEFGWRGYLLWELAPLGFWRASGLISVLWGVWHAPIVLDGYNYPSFPLVGVAVMTAATVAFSPLYTYFVVRARSVFAAGLFHGVFNAAAGTLLVYTATTDPVLGELVASPVGLAGIAAFALATVPVALVGVPSLNRAALVGGVRRPGGGGTDEDVTER
ncbi:CPBP family intramembrane glutamic endopeptidase [Halobellus limi]|uniref:CPBP family intramembrane metalloprotease n=1 Tax=Halobellus limi TaxID=699433 RepID=A0A1H5X1B0_9EURY|nr:type II CAAX endopeptidase family protein [Halobellus limi]QCC46285.1 CPBP family intramembrane metalloprotease [Halobellus limi]SEG05323.1 Membrane protease YdiL, CAAX protease family [Halobellus limi]